ncbi:MAG TPA: hypothetical protein VGL05_05440 [Kribbella sp.]
MITSPPDLRPETRERQRAELTAIVAHEADRKPHNHVVPLLAAAAVVTVTAGLAVGVPALRGGNGQGQGQGQGQAPAAQRTQAAQAARGSQAVAPLSDADKARFAKACSEHLRVPEPAREQNTKYQVLDGFGFTNPPADAYTTSWVVLKQMGAWTTCGFDAEGNLKQAMRQGTDQILYRPIETRSIGAGAYAAQIKRITIAVGNNAPVEAVLRNGYYYSATPYVRIRGPRTDETRSAYVVRGYDAAGKLVYTSPQTDGEYRARSNACYLDPNGKLVAWMSDNPHPDPKTCRRASFWNYGPN